VSSPRRRAVGLTARARVKIACGESRSAEADLREALAAAARTDALSAVPEAFEGLAQLASAAGGHHEAARLLGAADSLRLRMAAVRLVVFDGDFDSLLSDVRHALGDTDFEAGWAEGAALSTEEAIAYAQRGRGERKRPSSGWESLTPTELDVVRLVAEGIPNKDIAIRLFVSPRTVQSHLRHVYNKLASDLTRATRPGGGTQELTSVRVRPAPTERAEPMAPTQRSARGVVGALRQHGRRVDVAMIDDGSLRVGQVAPGAHGQPAEGERAEEHDRRAQTIEVGQFEPDALGVAGRDWRADVSECERACERAADHEPCTGDDRQPAAQHGSRAVP
jgi:DNA-binding CsgD family transcriptional regulator